MLFSVSSFRVCVPSLTRAEVIIEIFKVTFEVLVQIRKVQTVLILVYIFKQQPFPPKTLCCRSSGYWMCLHFSLVQIFHTMYPCSFRIHRETICLYSQGFYSVSSPSNPVFLVRSASQSVGPLSYPEVLQVTPLCEVFKPPLCFNLYLPAFQLKLLSFPKQPSALHLKVLISVQFFV